MTHVYLLMYSASEWIFIDLWRFINVIISITIIISSRLWNNNKIPDTSMYRSGGQLHKSHSITKFHWLSPSVTRCHGIAPHLNNCHRVSLNVPDCLSFSHPARTHADVGGWHQTGSHSDGWEYPHSGATQADVGLRARCQRGEVLSMSADFS